MVALGREAHGSTVAAAGAGLLVIGATGVPSQAQKDGAVAAVVIVFLLLETASDLVVHGLVVLKLGGEDLGRGRARIVRIEPVPAGGEGTTGSGPDPGGAVALGGGLGGVEAAAALAESDTRGGAQGGPGRGAQSASESTGCGRHLEVCGIAPVRLETRLLQCGKGEGEIAELPTGQIAMQQRLEFWRGSP